MTKENIKTQLKAIYPQIEEELVTYINSFPELISFNMKTKLYGNLDFHRSWTFKPAHPFEVRFCLTPDLEKTFGAELDVTCTFDDLTLNYGTCGVESLTKDESFIQKNLLIAALTIHSKEIIDFITTSSSVDEAVSLHQELEKIYKAECEAEWKAKKEAEEEAAKAKEAEKKAKAAARRKARREAKKLAENNK